MKIAALITIQVCAFLLCHTIADTGSRSKRTLKFFENFMNSMKEAFGPEPPDLPPPEVIAKLATLPYSNPYTYFPTIRMHIRPIKPVEKHVVYVKTLPPPAPSSLVMKNNLNDVEIIRLIQPLVRRPKSNSARIHYEIIPITIPIQEAPLHPLENHSPISSDPEFGNEDTAFSNVPWSLEALPPPVPTSKPLDSSDEHQVPWQLQALPPPMATKRPYWQPILKSTSSNDEKIFFPVKKKIMIPGVEQKKSRANFYDDKFMPSPLESEISIEPSMELTAFSETDARTVSPIPSFRGRRIFDKKDTAKFKSRSKRDTWANFPVYAELPKLVNGSTLEKASGNIALVPPLAFSARKFSTVLPALEESIVLKDDPAKFMRKLSNKSGSSDSGTDQTSTVLHFGESNDNQDTDSSSAYSEKREKRVKFTDDSVSIVKSHDILSDHPTRHEYIPIIPRKNSSSEFLGSKKDNNFVSRGSSSGFGSPSQRSKKRFNLGRPQTLLNKQSDTNERHRTNIYSNSPKFTSLSDEDDSGIPQHDGYFSKTNQGDAYDDLFGKRQQEKYSGGRDFDKDSDHKFKYDFDETPKSNFDDSPKYDFKKPSESYFDDSSKYDFEKPSKSHFDSSPKHELERPVKSNFDNSPKYDFDKSAKSSFDDSVKNNFQKSHHERKRPSFDTSAKYDFNKPTQFENDKPSEYDSGKSSKNDLNQPVNSDFYSNDDQEDKRPHTDYENIEFFEPVIIDIDSQEKSFGNFVSKFRPKSKPKSTPLMTESNQSNEPLKLPDSLHETVDVIKMRSAHPPTFDLMSEADDEHTVIATIRENEIR